MKYLIMKHKGIALVEIVIASAIMLSAVVAATFAYNTYVQYALKNQSNIQAGYLLEETLEAVTFIRDRGWTTYIAPLIPGTVYYIYFNGSLWVSTTTPQYVDGQFLRSFTVSDVSRDSNDDIVSSGTNDANTKLIVASVSYMGGHATTTKSISTYITNINSN